MTGADLLVRLLKAQDVPFVSTLCGNGLDPILAACKRQGLRLADVRNEQAAGYMADAAGRLTRRVGVCTSSSGVAQINALTGVVNAYFDGAPLLLTCGASAVVGWGLPAAIATKLIHPAQPVLLLSGDGALGFTITELETAVRLRTPIVVVVADDQAWGIVASDQKRALGEPIASLLGPVDYARVAQGFGARGLTVTRPEELAPAIRAAFASGEPTLIEVPIALRGPTD